ncbi:uncharacterized protein N7443_004649 [Penicillium atrosanguineum]|uniref:Uncharacterized protein n=1 Tax=Penicillium atrosanguineum TaxID=1132637 RepID=A0A9W9U869_9EURO|nr:uncharacterized protein N7443_004649 [Penicillium atrosanguineum]KAJ5133727.1 hypothetical protein N7526_005092 [Penicillium atrosanguineum]KAJ5304989.1 hypothetical protein N7443_004649 [Penicillium atrosanguineum]KAJ5324455.1 hypothetical protein N7476_003055 [Penicillium atrosanguineum]
MIDPTTTTTSTRSEIRTDPNPRGRPPATLAYLQSAPQWRRPVNASIPRLLPDCDILVYPAGNPFAPAFICTLRGLLFGNPFHVTVPNAEWVDTSTLCYTPFNAALKDTPKLCYHPKYHLLLWSPKPPRLFSREEMDERQESERNTSKNWLSVITQGITTFYNGQIPEPRSPIIIRPRIHFVIRSRPLRGYGSLKSDLEGDDDDDVKVLDRRS